MNDSFTIEANNHKSSITIVPARRGALAFTLSDNGSRKSIKLDQPSVTALRDYLDEYINTMVPYGESDQYVSTGKSVALLDGDSMDTLSVKLLDEPIDERNQTFVYFDGMEWGDDKQKTVNPIYVYFDRMDKAFNERKIRRIINACINYQFYYVRSGDCTKCRKMGLEEIENITSADVTVISRVTKDVKIFTDKNAFTMNCCDPSMDMPSLFDEGAYKTDGSICSRKEVLMALRQIIDSEDTTMPMTDEELAEELETAGYRIARRTVVKYRQLLGIGNSRDRKI